MNVKDLLERALYDYEAKVGAFMASGRELFDLRARAAHYFDSANGLVKSRSIAVADKVSGLLTDFQSIQGSALEAAKKAGEFKYKLDSDPLWRNIVASPWSNFGYETLKQARLIVGQITAVAADLSLVNKRMNRHLEALKAARADVAGLDDYAQGKGVAARADAFFNFSGSTVKSAAVIAAGLAVLAYVLPAGIARAGRR